MLANFRAATKPDTCERQKLSFQSTEEKYIIRQLLRKPVATSKVSAAGFGFQRFVPLDGAEIKLQPLQQRVRRSGRRRASAPCGRYRSPTSDRTILRT